MVRSLVRSLSFALSFALGLGLGRFSALCLGAFRPFAFGSLRLGIGMAVNEISGGSPSKQDCISAAKMVIGEFKLTCYFYIARVRTNYT